MTNDVVRFEPNKLTGYSESDIINEIRRVVEEFKGEIPNSTQFETIARVSLNSIFRQFGSYAKALEKAGFAYTRKYSVSRRKYSPEQVLDNLREVLARADGYQFDLKFYTENGGLFKSRSSVRNILGLSWEEALEKLGAKKRERVIHVSVHSQRLNLLAKLTTDDLLKELDLAWQEIGRCPTRSEFNHFSTKHTASLYKYRFGSWSKAIEVLCKLKGMPIPQIPGMALTRIVQPDEQQQSTHSSRTPVTKDDLINELQSVQNKHPDAQLTYALYKSNGGNYHIDSFRARFGSWAKAVEAAGSVPGGYGSTTRYSNEELFDEMQRLWEHIGRQPTFDEMRDGGKISPTTYCNRFGGWSKAIHSFCDDRNNDSTDDEVLSESPELLSSEDDKSKTEAKELLDNVSSVEPAPLIIVRKTGRAVPPRLRFRVFQRDNFTCRACGRSPATHSISLEADHITAYSNGGETIFENLQTLCMDCNRGKSNL